MRIVRWVMLGLLVMAGACSVTVNNEGGGDGASGSDGTSAAEGSDGADGNDGATGVDGTEGSDGVDGTSSSCSPTEPTDFLVLFGYRNRLPGMNEFDVNMMYPVQRYEPVKLTEFSLKETGKTCEYGCAVDDTIEWIAVNGAAPDVDGFDFQMGRFNSCLEVSLVKGAELADKAHFAFAKNFIYYSEKNDGCTGPSCQYSVWRLDLTNPADKKQIIAAFPPQDDPDWVNGSTTFKGRFRVSPDGESVILLSPTIRSQRVYIWTKGTLHEVDYLCENFQNGNCIGAGSEYSDRDPIAISPDSSTVVLFTLAERALRVRRYSTINPNDTGQSPLLSVATASGDADYNNVACALKEDWQFTHVVGNPEYTPDGKHIVFIGRSSCSPTAAKGRTNLYKIDPSWIGDLTKVEEHEVINLTNNPDDDSTANKEITSMTLSPDGQHVIFTATPHLTTSWAPISESDARHTTDREIYIVSICGGESTQLTSDVSLEASGPAAVPVPDLSSCPVSPLPDP